MTEAVPPPHSEGQPPQKSSLTGLRVVVRDISLSILLAVVVIVFFYQPVKVEGTSMMPALADQERIFVNKFVYRFGEIRRGDTVVFWFPGDPSKSFIKRVIGLPGDTVAVSQGVVLLNGTPLVEDYVPEDYRSQESLPPQRVPPDHYFVMGDHRNSSNDSRTWGAVHRSYIYGKAVFIYWPPARIGPMP